MTGDVYLNRPIAYKQELATVLWNEMGRVNNVSNYLGTVEEKQTDAEIIQQALKAVNGDKFKTLLDGNWNDLYPSQSEADFAFVDMVAFYTQSRNQIVRLFRNSALGQRDKAQRADYLEYMVNKAFDRILPPVDIEGLQMALEEVKAAHQAQQKKERLAALAPQKVTETENPYELPPGLLGDIAQFIYQSSPRQVPEIALAAAIAFMAGVTGRVYNISDTGLNQYVLLLAPTGTGKEAMASGIDKIVAALRDEIPAIKDFIGPAQMASGQALLKYLAKTSTSFLTIVGEFGLKMQQLSSPKASNSEIMLKQVLLDLYNKSGVKRTLQPSIYSQTIDSTQLIYGPNVVILGESTPETFFKIVDEAIIADGLLPRFNIIEYTGKRPPLNHNHDKAEVSPELKNRIALLVAHCLRLNNGINGMPMAVAVQSTPEAAKLINEYDIFADDKVNGSNTEVIKQLWTRAHMKLLKLAATVAVGVDAYNPVIQVEHVKWAQRLVTYDIERLYVRFAAGDFGSDIAAETKQQRYIKEAFAHYLMNEFAALKMYVYNEELHKAKIVPYAFISKKLVSAAPFRADKQGATTAIKRTLQTLIDSGYIKEIGKHDLSSRFNTSQRAFMVVNMEWLR